MNRFLNIQSSENRKIQIMDSYKDVGKTPTGKTLQYLPEHPIIGMPSFITLCGKESECFK